MPSLSLRERAVLQRLLSVPFDEVDALRAQVDAISTAEPNCTCGCPSFTPTIDHSLAPPAHCGSPLAVELVEMSRPDGVPRAVLCFLDQDGYIANVECVYYDDPIPEWPDPECCAVMVRDKQGYFCGAALPNGTAVRPSDPHDPWVSFEAQPDGGFSVSTWSGYREFWASDGTPISRVFTK